MCASISYINWHHRIKTDTVNYYWYIKIVILLDMFLNMLYVFYVHICMYVYVYLILPLKHYE